MSFMDAISYPMKDSNWMTKLLILLVLVLIPILGWLVIGGYVLRVIRMVQNGEEALPEWDDFGGDFVRGIMALVGYIIYYFPSILLSCCTSILGNSDSAGAAALNCLLSLAQLGYSILIIPIWFTAISRYAQNEDFNAMLDFGGNLRGLTEHMSDAVMLWINYIVLSIIMFIVIAIGLLLLCIPGLFAIAFSILANGHLVGQWGRIVGGANPNAMVGQNYA
jgi:hypothetical protein